MKRTGHARLLTTITMTTAAACLAQPTDAAIVTYENAAGGDFRLASITGLDILDETYDVDFVHGGTFEDLAALPGSPIEFPNFNNAREAAKQIALAVNALDTDSTGFTSLPGNVRVPYLVRGEGTLFNYARSTRVFTSPIFLSENPSSSTTSVTSQTSASGSTTTEWALFTVVPEPSSLGLLSLGGLLVARRRRD